MGSVASLGRTRGFGAAADAVVGVADWPGVCGVVWEKSEGVAQNGNTHRLNASDRNAGVCMAFILALHGGLCIQKDMQYRVLSEGFLNAA
jgi:hypothetical protein